ncbi:unnamed protein product, partial [Ranitomeya imitator]
MKAINPLARAFTMMREFEIEEERIAELENRDPLEITMSIVNDYNDDQRCYNAPRCNEVAIIYQKAMGEPPTPIALSVQHQGIGDIYLPSIPYDTIRAKSYSDLRNVNGVLHDTYKNACIDLHLLEDDSQWEDGIMDAIAFQMPYQLLKLFAI